MRKVECWGEMRKEKVPISHCGLESRCLTVTMLNMGRDRIYM